MGEDLDKAGVRGGRRIAGSGNHGQRHMKLIEELDEARVSPSGALGFEKFLSKGLTHLSRPISFFSFLTVFFCFFSKISP